MFIYKSPFLSDIICPQQVKDPVKAHETEHPRKFREGREFIDWGEQVNGTLASLLELILGVKVGVGKHTSLERMQL